MLVWVLFCVAAAATQAAARDAAALQAAVDRTVLWAHGGDVPSPATIAAINNIGVTVRRELKQLGITILTIPESAFSESGISAATVNANVVASLTIATGLSQFEPDRVVYANYNLAKVGATADGAWSVTRGSANVSVLVVDTGIDYTHPNLASKMWVNPGEIAGDGLDNDGNGYIDDVHGIDVIVGNGDPMDQNDHGTHVAGIIAADLYGVAPGVRVGGCRFLDAGGGSVADAAECIDYGISMGFNVTNNSWGGSGACDAGGALRTAVDKTVAANQLFVAAAGNSNSDLDTTPHVPAVCPGAFTVGSTDAADQKSWFSNYGSAVDLWAPGSLILSTVRNDGSNDGTATFSGTSMSAPHVAGAAALLLSLAGPDGLSITSLKSQMMADADEVNGRKRLNAARLVGGPSPAPAPSAAPGRVCMVTAFFVFAACALQQ